jgi:hypothetical protein
LAVALATTALVAASAPSALAAPPTVTISEPLGGAVTNSPMPIFAGTAEPLGTAVTVNVYSGPAAAGVPVYTQAIEVLSPGGAWSLVALETFPDGVYTATASQMNAGLETGTSAPVTFRIDTSAPLVTLDQPQPAPGETAPSFGGTASDTTPVTVQIHAGDSIKGTIVSLATAAGTGGGWHSTATTPALPVGRYMAVAVQLSGKLVGSSEPMPFEVSPAPPAPPPGTPPQSGVATIAQVHPPAQAIPLMAPFPVVRIAGVSFGGGLKLRLLKVQQAPAGAIVIVRCRGRGCPSGATRRVTAAGPHGVPAIVFGRFQRYLRAGAVVEVLVSKAGLIGKYTRLRVRRGKLPERVDLCLDAAGVRPIACPAG